MFDISFFEIMIISVVALIVVGPERLPQVARTLGHLMSRCRQFVYSVKTDIHNEIRMEELKHMHSTMQETAQSIEDSVRREINEIKETAGIKPPESPEKTTAAKTETIGIQPAAARKTSTTGTLTQPSEQESQQPRQSVPDKAPDDRSKSSRHDY